uniref:Uncharacterized protein n=1 Tax=Steinernema glaseri TaxID=37863 RepID=A0A1I8A7K4_9BILA
MEQLGSDSKDAHDDIVQFMVRQQQLRDMELNGAKRSTNEATVPLYKLWGEFEYEELLENMRQPEDEEFALLIEYINNVTNKISTYDQGLVANSSMKNCSKTWVSPRTRSLPSSSRISTTSPTRLPATIKD